jgi:hypothetical protein
MSNNPLDSDVQQPEGGDGEEFLFSGTVTNRVSVQLLSL